MDIYEEAVLNYITQSNQRFVNPQFSLAYDAKQDIGGSLPDFVVLDFKLKTIFIVEVSKAYDIKNLLAKAKKKEERWILPLGNIIDSELNQWNYHVTLFVREERVKYARESLREMENISVISLKNINCFLGNGEFEGQNSLIVS